jgi:UDP-glucose 4-epimerase
MKKCFLVTGASGFIGYELVRYLKEHGMVVRALLREPAKGPWDECVVVDLSTNRIPAEVMSSVYGVFHLAGATHTAINTSDKSIDYYRRVNVVATQELLKLAQDSKVERFVYFSSVKASGESNDRCLDENSACAPVDVYGSTKLEAEKLVLDAGKRAGIHVCNIRPALVYGRGVKGNLAQMLNSISQNTFPVLPEFHNKRSMISLQDVVSAACLAMDDEKANGQTYIITDGIEYSTRQIYLAMCEILGKKITQPAVPVWALRLAGIIGDMIEMVARKPMPIDSSKFRKLVGSACYDSSKIRNELGWLPKYSLYDVLPEMVGYIRANS